MEGRTGVEQRIRALGAAPSKRGRAVGIALVACLMVAGFTSAQTERPTTPAPQTSQKEPEADPKVDATADLLREMERRELAERAANAQYQFDPAKLLEKPNPAEITRQRVAERRMIDSLAWGATNSPATDLRTRRFSIPDVSRFLNFIGAEGPTATLQEPLRKFFEELGINLTPPRVAPSGDVIPGLATPPQKAFFFAERTGMLFVRATMEDLDAIGRALHKMFPLLMVTTIGVVVEASSDAAIFSSEFFKAAETVLMKNAGKELSLLGTMTSVEFDKLRPDLGNQGAVVLTSPRITSLSGRAAMVGVGLERNASGEATTEVSFTTRILPEPHMMRVEAGLRFLNVDSVSGTEEELLSARGTGEVWDGQALVFGVRAPEGDKFYLLFVTPSISPKDLEAP